MINNPLLSPALNRFTDAPTFFSSLIRVFFTFLIIMAAVYFFFNMVMGGIDWMGSAGDKAKLEGARQRVVNAVIGVIVVFGIFIIINFIEAVFGIQITSFSLSSLQI